MVKWDYLPYIHIHWKSRFQRIHGISLDHIHCIYLFIIVIVEQHSLIKELRPHDLTILTIQMLKYDSSNHLVYHIPRS